MRTDAVEVDAGRMPALPGHNRAHKEWNRRGYLPHFGGDPVFISWSDDPELSAIPDQLPIDGQHVTHTKPGSAGILPACG